MDTQPVRYGDEIMLTDTKEGVRCRSKIRSIEASSLFLFQLFLTCIKSSGRSGRSCDVVFSNNPGRNSVWIVMHPGIHLRMELDGSEVRIDDRVVLAHAATNKCLSVNEEHSNR